MKLKDTIRKESSKIMIELEKVKNIENVRHYEKSLKRGRQLM